MVTLHWKSVTEDPPAWDDWVGAAGALEGATATEIVSWSVERFGTGLAFACSFQNCALLDIAVGVDPTIEVLFLDTGFHFPRRSPSSRSCAGATS